MTAPVTTGARHGRRRRIDRAPFQPPGAMCTMIWPLPRRSKPNACQRAILYRIASPGWRVVLRLEAGGQHDHLPGASVDRRAIAVSRRGSVRLDLGGVFPNLRRGAGGGAPYGPAIGWPRLAESRDVRSMQENGCAAMRPSPSRSHSGETPRSTPQDGKIGDRDSAGGPCGLVEDEAQPCHSRTGREGNMLR